MGASASLITNELKEKADHLVKRIESEDKNTRLEALEELFYFANDDNFSLLLCTPEINLLPLLGKLVTTEDNEDVLKSVMLVLSQLTYCDPAVKFLCDPDSNLIPTLVSYMSLKPELTEDVKNILFNCFQDSSAAAFILTPEFGYIDYWLAHIEGMLQDLKHVRGEKRSAILIDIKNIIPVEECKEALCLPEFEFLATLVQILREKDEEQKEGEEEKDAVKEERSSAALYVFQCIAYLTAGNATVMDELCGKFDYLPLAMDHLRTRPDLFTVISDQLSAASAYEELQIFFFDPKARYLAHWRAEMAAHPNRFTAYRNTAMLLSNLSEGSPLFSSFLLDFLDLDLPALVLDRLLSFGPDPLAGWDYDARDYFGLMDFRVTKMSEREALAVTATASASAKLGSRKEKAGSGEVLAVQEDTAAGSASASTWVSFWCLNFVYWLSHYRRGAEILRALLRNSSAPRFFEELAERPLMEGMKARLLLVNLFGRDEVVPEKGGRPLLEADPSLLPFLVDALHATLNFGEADEVVAALQRQSFYFGLLKMRELTAAVRSLAVSQTNQPQLAASASLLRSLGQALRLFVDDEPPTFGLDDACAYYGGGGGDDEATLLHSLEALLSLSFHWPSDDSLATAFQLPGHDLRGLLEALLALPASRNVPTAARELAGSLLHRLAARPLAPETPAHKKAGPGRQHVMLSYCRDTDRYLLIALARILKELGYDVWRYEEGSSLVDGTGGGEAELVYQSIHRAALVLVAVSAQYKESALCRAEAHVIHGREQQDGLPVVFLRTQEHYRPDGWLAEMAGPLATELPLWEGGQMEATTKALTKLIGEHAMLSDNVPAPPSTDPDDPPRRSPRPGHDHRHGHGRGSRDCQTGWECLRRASKVTDPEALSALMEELRLAAPDDLQALERRQLEYLALLLHPAQETKFRGAMGIPRDEEDG